ncbi:hypothetical protein CMI37_01760 [Candidatus Pacearchaeota archaeon]|nr:hypothetical protein [Candidatus Pacearchaeota archaeon]
MLNTYQRPLFRQAGGPAGLAALPPPPPAGVAAIPQQDPRAMVEAAGQTASSEMESVGQDYVTEMMQSLDTAENFKTVIDALRGNELPIDQRFAELAEYVGEEDAEKTPESVLTMVQPVIMMTEEGNVDSGIGQLMQSLTGEVDMMTEEGGLTDMGQGVGSLMVANQAPPPPQRFADGGAVQHFANGGSPFAFRPGASYLSPSFAGTMQEFAPQTAYDPQALQAAYTQRLPMYMGILDPEKERAMTKSQIMFDISQAGLNLASGVDPRTGQSMTSLPVASQIATAAGGLPQQIGARAAMSRQSEQAAKLAALQGAEAETTATRAAVARERERVLGGAFGMASQGQALETDLFKAGLLHGNEQERMRLAAEIEEMRESHAAQEGRVTQEARFDLQSKENRLLFQDRLAEIVGLADQEIRVYDKNERLRSGLELGRQQDRQDWRSGENELDRETTTWIKEQEFEDQDEIIAIKDRLMGLQEAKFEDFQERGPATYVPWYKYPLGGPLVFDTEARNAWQAQNKNSLEQQDLMNRLMQYEVSNVGVTQQFQQYMSQADHNLRLRQQNLIETEFAYGVLMNQMMPVAREEFTVNQMSGLLSDPMAIRAYAAGAPMPEVEYALSQRYQIRYDPETGLQNSPALPPGWRAAIAAREKLGIAAHRPYQSSEYMGGEYMGGEQEPQNPGRDIAPSERPIYGLPPGGIPYQYRDQGIGVPPNSIAQGGEQEPDTSTGWGIPWWLKIAEGGEVKKMQGGGDPRGLYEPTTGTYLPRPVADEPLPIEEPLITATGQGIDITSATGSDAWLMNKANTAFEAVSGILGGPGVVIGEEYQEAMRALDSFNQIALTRALGSIAGRENRELQERLARLEVPAGEFLYGDRKALAQFQTSSRVMDFAIREQEAALRGPRLTRTERNKARKDLAALQGIQLEYDRLADAYTRKIEGDTADVSSRLDEFFN